MTEAERIKYLRIALVVVGLTFTFGIWPLTIVWPSGWSWHPRGRSEYLEMILGIYATLGVFLMLASGTQKPNLVCGLVEYCSRRDCGCSVCRQSPAHWASLGGRFGFDCRRSSIGSPDSASDGCNEITISGIW